MQAQDNFSQELIKKALEIQQNCEYLSNIKIILNSRSNSQKQSYLTLDSYLQETKIKLNIESILHFYIQLAYLLSACHSKSVSLSIDVQNDIRIQQIFVKNSEKRFKLVLWCKVCDQKMENGKAISIYNNAINYTKDRLNDYIEQNKANLESDLLEQLQVFYNQHQNIMSNNALLQRQAIFFLSLEQTNIFYQYSLLYRIKNCSMLDYIKGDDTRLKEFRKARNNDYNFTSEYNKQKKNGKKQQQTLRNKQKQIQNNINAFFESIRDNEKSFLQVKNKDQKDQLFRVKFYYYLSQRQKLMFEDSIQKYANGIFSRKEISKLKQYKKRPITQLQFFIEYSSEKNHIGVKLHMPNSFVNVENSDFLMYQSNSLTFKSVNVSIELSQPRNRAQEGVPSKKVVTFKSSSWFNIKQPPLQKILLLMDITMIASRIFEPELNQNRLSGPIAKDYAKIQTIDKKISHYTKFFMKCAKHIYSQ